MASKQSSAPWRRFQLPGGRRGILLGLLGALVVALAVMLAAWASACAGNACPSLAGLDDYDPAQASKVYAADGRLITDLGLERRTVVPLTQISPAVVKAFLATEDKRFYEHHGIDWYRVFGAMKGVVLGGRVTGASTITMQLARNLFPEDISGRDRSLRRKLREAHVALDIERKFSKDKILELYLNQIDLGNRAYGVEVAAQRYFGKSSGELNLAEAATLAAIPKAPATYNPRRNPARSIQRRNLVLELLQEQGDLTDEAAERWKAYPLQLSSRSDFSGVADYFVEFVRQQMQARFGDQLYRDGLRIYTTLDLDMQVAAERALETQLSTIEAGGARYGKWTHPTYAQYLDKKEDASEGPSQSPYLQGLVLTLDAKTGFVRAMVGGRDFEDSKFNRVTQSRRQPGSTFKPIVYTAALEQGHTLSELVVDEPFSLDIPGQATWTPQNYDLKFGGQMTLRRALFDSRNIPTIKLGQVVGEQTVIDEARRFGISTNVRAVPSIHIGSADVVPMEMIAAYTAYANLGVRTVPEAILRVEDRSGRILWQPQPKKVTVLEPAVAWLITDVLRDVVRKGTASGTVGAQINFTAAGKTGTTNDGFDVWYIGFTPELVTGVWMGFDQPQKIAPNAQGGRLAAPAWTMMMNEVYARRPSPGGWARPEDLVAAEIDTSSGGLATPFCPREFRFVESYAPGTAPVAYCPLHSQLLGVPGMTPTPAQPRTLEAQGGQADGRTGGRAAEAPLGPSAAIPGAATSNSAPRPRPEAPPARPAAVPPPKP